MAFGWDDASVVLQLPEVYFFFSVPNFKETFLSLIFSHWSGQEVTVEGLSCNRQVLHPTLCRSRTVLWDFD